MRRVLLVAVLVAVATRTSRADTPAAQVEAVLRAHLRDPEMKTCLTGSSAYEHVIYVHRSVFEGSSMLVATDQDTDTAISNCLTNHVIIPLTRNIEPTAELWVRLNYDPKREALGLEVLHEPPRTVTTAAPVELVAGALGGAGDRDGPASDARFDLPLGIAVDPTGDLVVADVGSRRIRRVERTTGRVSTLAPAVPKDRASVTDRRATEQPVALAYDAAGRLHLLEASYGQILLVTPSGLELEYKGTYGTASALEKPLAMAFDGDGSLIVADTGNHRLVRIDLARKTLVEVAGTSGTHGFRDGKRPLFSYPEGLALDGAGHAYVAEWSNHTIREVTLATGETRTIAGGQAGHVDGVGRTARFDAPSTLVYDRGALYVAESQGLTIRRVDVATRRVTTLAGAYKRAGAADGAGGRARFDHYGDNGVGEVPFGLALAAGALYLTDTGNHAVRRIALDSGEVTTLAGRLAPGETLRGLVFGADENLYTTIGEGVYRRRDGGFARVGRARFEDPVGIAAARDGSLVIAELAGRVRRLDPRTGAVSTVADLDHLLRAIAVAPSGTIVVGGSGELFEITRGARPSPIPASGPLGSVGGIALDGDKIYVLDSRPYQYDHDRLVMVLREIDRAAGTRRTLASWFVPVRGRRWPFPEGLTLAGGGLYLAPGNGAVVRFDLATHAETVVVAPVGGNGAVLGAAPSTNRPRAPVMSPSGELTFIDERAVLRVR